VNCCFVGYGALGFPQATGHDETFRQLVLARIIEPTTTVIADQYVDWVCLAKLHRPGRQGGDDDVVDVGVVDSVRAGVVLEGGDDPALWLFWEESGQS
jgi:hypothetical protein